MKLVVAIVIWGSIILVMKGYTLRIKPDLLRRAKAQAAIQGVSFNEFVIILLDGAISPEVDRLVSASEVDYSHFNSGAAVMNPTPTRPDTSGAAVPVRIGIDDIGK